MAPKVDPEAENLKKEIQELYNKIKVGAVLLNFITPWLDLATFMYVIWGRFMSIYQNVFG